MLTCYYTHIRGVGGRIEPMLADTTSFMLFYIHTPFYSYLITE
jgi:hypothetical protein